MLALCSAQPLDPVLTGVVEQIKGQVYHIHARYGYDHGPQIWDPRDPYCAPRSLASLLCACFMATLALFPGKDYIIGHHNWSGNRFSLSYRMSICLPTQVAVDSQVAEGARLRR